jgi:Glycosyltransferases, probably involved in cell wall biogenesis
MPKISVIIPVYGVEKYIERCARSLFEQTLDDIEYVFVNDYTKDKSIVILNRVINDYPKRKSNVLILHHDVNMGLPIARQTGLKVAKGDYIAHCDSDDWVDKDMYRALYEKIVAEKADVIICDYYMTAGCENGRIFSACIGIDKYAIIKDMMTQKIAPSVWNKLVRRQLYDDIVYYPKDGMGEDIVLTVQLIWYSKSITYINKPFYKYFVNNQSITLKADKESYYRRYEQLRRNTDLLVDFMNANYDRDDKKKLIYYVQYSVVSQLLKILHCDNAYKQAWTNTYPGMLRSLLLNSKTPLNVKLKIILTALGFYPFKKDRVC